jgi:hypothetical protein
MSTNTAIAVYLPKQNTSILKGLIILVTAILLSFAVKASTINPVIKGIDEVGVKAVGNNIILSWEADKVTFSYYELQKSDDGVNFKTVGLVLDAPEDSNTCLFKDLKANAANAKIFYRVNGVQANGNIVVGKSNTFVAATVN